MVAQKSIKIIITTTLVIQILGKRNNRLEDCKNIWLIKNQGWWQKDNLELHPFISRGRDEEISLTNMKQTCGHTYPRSNLSLFAKFGISFCEKCQRKKAGKVKNRGVKSKCLEKFMKKVRNILDVKFGDSTGSYYRNCQNAAQEYIDMIYMSKKV